MSKPRRSNEYFRDKDGNITHKRCWGCDEFKPVSLFFINRGKYGDGWFSRCAQCYHRWDRYSKDQHQKDQRRFANKKRRRKLVSPAFLDNLITLLKVRQSICSD